MENGNSAKIIKLIFRGLIPLCLVISGTAIFLMKISVWSLFIGLPMTLFGFVFTIYSFDEFSQKTVDGIEEVVNCSICGKPTPKEIGLAEEETICPSCEVRISRLFKGKKDKKQEETS